MSASKAETPADHGASVLGQVQAGPELIGVRTATCLVELLVVFASDGFTADGYRRRRCETGRWSRVPSIAARVQIRLALARSVRAGVSRIIKTDR